MTLGGFNFTWTPIHDPVVYVPYSGKYYVRLDAVDAVRRNGRAIPALGNVGAATAAHSVWQNRRRGKQWMRRFRTKIAG